MRRMLTKNDVKKLANGVTPEALTENLEGGIGVSVDLNEAGDKVAVGLDLTGGSAGKVLAIDSTGNDVEWKEVSAGGGTT